MEDKNKKPNPGGKRPAPGRPKPGVPPRRPAAAKPAAKPAAAKPVTPPPAAAKEEAKPTPEAAKAPTATPVPGKADATADKSKGNKPQKPAKPPKAPKEKKEKKGRAGTIILLILTLLFAGGAGFLGWKYYEENKTLDERTIERDKAIQESKKYMADIEELEKQLEERKQTIASLQGDTTALHQQIIELRKEKKIAWASGARSRAQVSKLKKLADDYAAMLQEQDSELIKLRAIRDEQMKNITELKTTVADRDNTISEREQTIAEHEATIEKGQKLAASDFKVTVITKKAKEKVDIKSKGYKSKDIAKLKVNFNIAANEIAEENIKTYYMVLKEPSGTGLQGNLAAGTFEDINGKTFYYATKKDDTYSQGGRNITMVYQREPSYVFKSGKNIVEVYCEGKLIGNGTFLVK